MRWRVIFWWLRNADTGCMSSSARRASNCACLISDDTCSCIWFGGCSTGKITTCSGICAETGCCCWRWCNVKGFILDKEHGSGKNISRKIHVGCGTVNRIGTDYRSSGTIPRCNATSCLISLECFPKIMSGKPIIWFKCIRLLFYRKQAWTPAWMICNDFVNLFN